MQIGVYIKQQRKLKKLTIDQMEKKSGVSKSSISRIERNESNPFDSISKLLEALDLTVEDANAAGVNWWASPAPSTSAASTSAVSDLDYIYSWLQKQDDKTLKRIRLLIEVIEKTEE